MEALLTKGMIANTDIKPHVTPALALTTTIKDTKLTVVAKEVP